MKKLIIAMMLISSTIFASEFKYYRANIKNCVEKLNELKKDYHIISYQIIPAGDAFDMIIEVEKKGGSEC